MTKKNQETQHGRDTHLHLCFLDTIRRQTKTKQKQTKPVSPFSFIYFKNKFDCVSVVPFDVTLTLKPCNAGSHCMFDGTPSFRTVLTLLKRPMVREMQNMFVTRDIVL
uniref:Uncharacterized protein n=1 Tax=Micrurus corallinus TaxID=54390 RepID=A0A2D4FLU4_MICCO